MALARLHGRYSIRNDAVSLRDVPSTFLDPVEVGGWRWWACGPKHSYIGIDGGHHEGDGWE